MLDVCICFTDSNGRYYRQALLAMASVMDNCKQDITVHIITDDSLAPANRNKFYEIAKLFGKEVTFAEALKLPKNIMEMPVLGRFTHGSLYRLMIPELLNADRVLYLDSDTICNTDISRLFDLDLGNAYIGGCLETNAGRKDDKKHFESLGIDYRRYINAGVLLFNNKRIRSEFPNFLDDILALVAKGYALLDQDALNIFFSAPDDIHILPSQYNFHAIHLDHAYLTGEVLQGKIIHYTRCRPWEYFYPSALPYYKYEKICFPELDIIQRLENLPAPPLRKYRQMLFMLRNDLAWKTVRRIQDVTEKGLWQAVVSRIKR